MSLIENFEKKIGMKVEGLNEEKFLKIIKNPEITLSFFNDSKKCLDLLEEIIKRKQDDESFVKELQTAVYTLNLEEDQKILDTLFEKYREEKITRDELIKKMQNFKNSSDPIFVILSEICLMMILKDVDLSDDKELLEKNIDGIKNIFSSLGRIETSYKLRCDLIDLLYKLKTGYFVKYKYSFNLEWVDDEILKLYEFENQFNKRELPEVNIKPEQLGFIDITKLKKE